MKKTVSIIAAAAMAASLTFAGAMSSFAVEGAADAEPTTAAEPTTVEVAETTTAFSPELLQQRQ